MSWTDERVERLKKLWADGWSASQIAQELGDVTRNAVIGKVHRLGIAARSVGPKSGRQRSSVKRATANRASRPRPPRRQTPAPDRKISLGPDQDMGDSYIPTTVEVVFGEPVSLLELTEQTCRWPVGNPGEADFRFCGAEPVEGQPYCKGHMAVAYQPPASRRDRSRSGQRSEALPGERRYLS